MESLKREKEERARLLGVPQQHSTGDLPVAAPTAVRGGLRRTLTDTKPRGPAHKKLTSQSTASSGDELRAPSLSYIPRDSSPLKRHRTNSDRPSSKEGLGPGQDLKIVVDQHGHALPVVVEMSPASKARVASFTQSAPRSKSRWEADDDSEDLPESSSRSSGTVSSHSRNLESIKKATHAPGDARAALQQLIEARQTGQDATSVVADLADSLSTHAPYASSTGSPTAKTGPRLYSSGKGRRHTSKEVRCVCGTEIERGVNLIQCESCSNWLHLTCLGLDPARLPKVFVCSFCSATPARGGRAAYRR